jgi:hypothetical protein
LKIVQNATFISKIQEALQSFSVWDQNSLIMNKLRHHAQGAILRMKRTDITGHAGALMGSTDPRSEGYSGCVAWKKLKPSTWKH